ncbi:MAG: hypothetical protein JW772_03530, partial [Candidatus Diapherotrites archaeon]|nr:hypothetical protein [Candidatus Diapherotrites archaeon]
YSAFDKYFNSWFATDLVVNAFGPTLVGQAKRYLGNLGRRGWPWQMSTNKFYDAFRRNFMSPTSLLGQARIKNLATRTDKFGFGDYRKALWEGSGWQSGYSAIKGGGTRKLLDDWLKAGGKLESEITDPVRRGEFFKVVKEWRSVARTHASLQDEAFNAYKSVVSRYGHGSAEEIAARIQYAQKNTKLMKELDNIMHLDFPEFWAKEPVAGLFNKGMRETTTGQIIKISEDSSNISEVMRKFETDAHFGDWGGYVQSRGGHPGRLFESTDDGFLQLYKPTPKGSATSVPFEDLQKNFSQFQDKMVVLDDGTELMLDAVSINHIKENAAPSGMVKVYNAGWEKAEAVTPEDWASRFTRFRVNNRMSRQLRNHVERLYNGVIEKGWAGQNRRYLSLLDKAMSQEEEIIKSYFSLKGGAKWTVLPYAYWGAKQGFGFEGLSAYQLPDTWTSAVVTMGESDLYDDAFIDFFANEGSDDGDIFARVLNILPWKMVLNKVHDEYAGFDSYDAVTGRGPEHGYRNEVENLALFTNTGDTCKTCAYTLNSSDFDSATGRGDVRLTFNTKEGTKNILLEDVLTNDAKEDGTTIIAFTHHTNIDWDVDNSDPETEIDLVQAGKDEETCRDALDRAPVVGWFGTIFDGKPHRAGAALAFGESLLYATFGWTAIMGSVIQQTLITPEFQDCVDDLEGYYIHLFSPTDDKKKEAESPNQKASEKGSEVIKNVSLNLTGEANKEDQSKGFFDIAKDKIREESQKLADKVASKDIVQATLNTKNLSSGQFFSQKLFFFWFKGEQNVSRYDTKSKTLVEDVDSDIDVLIDKEQGKIFIDTDGQITPEDAVITSPDHVRLTAPNGNIPAEEIPQRLTKMILPETNELIFYMGINSELRAADTELGRQVLACIRDGVKQQTGLPLNSDNLTEAFGKVKAIVSDTHPNIFADEGERTITAEGSPREIVYGNTAHALVSSNRNVELSGGLNGSGNARVGRADSIQFENGVIVFNGNEMIVWLKRHENAILNQNDVEGLVATPTVYDDPDVECPDPAINLEAIPKSGSDLIEKKVENFNTSMDTMGPFKVFDTDTHRYIFYSKKVDGVCKDFFKMIDKETGEVYDAEIVGGLENTPTGVKFKTADGKEHTLDFDTENGIPMVSYNGQTPEVLKTATGPNGSFWYDPTTGNWYPENAQLIPLDDSFRTQGFNTSVGPDGKVSQTPGGNPLTVNVGSGTGMPFNLPSLPSGIGMMLFVGLLFAVIIVFRIRIGNSRRE